MRYLLFGLVTFLIYCLRILVKGVVWLCLPFAAFSISADSTLLGRAGTLTFGNVDAKITGKLFLPLAEIFTSV